MGVELSFEDFVNEQYIISKQKDKPMLHDKKFQEAWKKIGAKFIAKAKIKSQNDEPITLNQAKDEIKLIEDKIGIAEFFMDPKKYIKMSRVGAKFPINRKTKHDIIMALDNAGNHASIEAGYK